MSENKASSKTDELAKAISEALVRLDLRATDDESLAIVAAFCTIRRPQIEMPELEFKHDLTSFGRDTWKHAVNYRPGNITLNIRKLLNVVASGTLLVGGAVSAPWTIPFAALLLWDIVYSGVQCELSEHVAVVLWVMWKLVDPEDCVAHNHILPAVNEELGKAGRPHMSKPQLNEAIAKLTSLKCIARSKTVSDAWWLREWVSAPYNME